MAYHIKEITKGELGKVSKITEEYEEFLDANQQMNSILELCELADLVGAIDHYLRVKYTGLDIHSLVYMAKATEKAFKDGSR